MSIIPLANRDEELQKLRISRSDGTALVLASREEGSRSEVVRLICAIHIRCESAELTRTVKASSKLGGLTAEL